MRRRHLFLLFDVAAVVAFVVIGRDTHNEGGGIGGVVETAAPFLVALVLGWGITRAWREPESARTGAGVAAFTVVTGMFARRNWFDEGIALSFIAVASVFLGGTMLGWRAAVLELRRRRQASIEPSK